LTPYKGVSIDIPFLSPPDFKQKTVFLAAFKAVDAKFTFATRAVFMDFKPFHRQTSLPIPISNFKTLNQVQGQGGRFNYMNIFNFSSVEPLDPTQKLGLKEGFDTTSATNNVKHPIFSKVIS
jgi:hypothetical protein